MERDETAAPVEVVDDGLAEYVMQRRQAIAGQKAALTASYKKAIASLDAEDKSIVYRYGAAMDNWIAAKIAALSGRKKSVNTLYGTYGVRSSALSFTVTDEEALIGFAVAGGLTDLLSTNKTGVNKLAKSVYGETNGQQCIPGVQAVLPKDVPYMRFPVSEDEEESNG